MGLPTKNDMCSDSSRLCTCLEGTEVIAHQDTQSYDEIEDHLEWRGFQLLLQGSRWLTTKDEEPIDESKRELATEFETEDLGIH